MTFETDKPIVMVVGATGSLGGHIVDALVKRGAHVRAMVRATSDRTKLKSLGVTDFVVADLGDAASLRRVLAIKPAPAAIVASAAGFTGHAAATKGNNPNVDIDGYRALVDASLASGVPRFILISILNCDLAPHLPHFRQKLDTERYLAENGQPYLSLRAGAFLDRATDIVPDKIKEGVFPDILPGVPMSLIYSRDLGQYAAQAALDLPDNAMNQAVDIGCDVPVTGDDVALAFSEVLGRPIVAKPVFPRIVFTLLPLIAWAARRLRDNLAVLKWLRTGGYISHNTEAQKQLFGPLPTVRDAVARYCQDKALH